MDIEEFYDADPRRRESGEIEFGRDWSDDAGGRCEVSWVVDTGELYVMQEPIEPVYSDGLGDVAVQHVPTEDVTVEILAVVPSRGDRRDLRRLGAGDAAAQQHRLGA